MEAGTGQSQSTISQHLMRLKAAGVVRCERQGNEMYYEVSDPDAAAVVAALFGDKECDYNCPMTLRSSEAVRRPERRDQCQGPEQDGAGGRQRITGKVLCTGRSG